MGFWSAGWRDSIENHVTRPGAIWKLVEAFLLAVIPEGNAGSQGWKARHAESPLIQGP